MSYCFNPDCLEPNNDYGEIICSSCGASLLLHERYRGIGLLGKSQLALTLEVEDIRADRLDRVTNKTKVLKILLTDYTKAIELFRQEAEILSMVKCEGIPKIAEDGYFSCHPQWYRHSIHCLVIEKVIGMDLEQWLDQNQDRLLSQQQAQDWFKQLSNILAQLHQQQYFHRDIKPSNIILQPNGKLVLIDFGAARKVTKTYLGKIAANRSITSIGTPGYIAPEQIDGAALPQSDFFSLGRTFIHLLTGKHPQEFPKNLETGTIVWREQAPQASVAFADLLDLMVNHSPSKRPVNVEAIDNYLTRVEKYPDRPLDKSISKLKLVSPISVAVFLPLAILGLLSLGGNLRQQVTNNDTSDAPLCNNRTCTNRDPIDNKCDRDAQTITSNIANYPLGKELMAYRIEVRYSPQCNAVWARSEAPYRSSHYIEDGEGKIYGRVEVIRDGWNRHYADMAPGKDIQIRACAKPPTGQKSCTNFVEL